LNTLLANHEAMEIEVRDLRMRLEVRERRVEELEDRLACTNKLFKLLSKQGERAPVPVPAPKPQPVPGPSASSPPAPPPAPALPPPRSPPPPPPIAPLEQITPTPALPAVSMPAPVIPVPITDMAPPSLPSSLQATFDIPAVQLLPPTPQTSQEAANYAPTTLLQVPAHGDAASALPPSPHSPTIRCSRSRSPAPDVADLRRSPRLGQLPVPAPVPAPKWQADTDIEEPVAKKQRHK